MVELRVLGALNLVATDQPDVRSLTRQAKRAALLAYLAVATPRGDHRRDKLLALFWPEFDSRRARAALSQAVYVLRSTLGEHAITSRGDGQVGLARDVVWCDAVAFEAALAAGRPSDAMSLYRGDLLDGFFLSDAPEFERWLDGERARLRQCAAEGSWALAEAAASAGEALEAARWARRAFEFYPADEAGARRLITFLHALGDRAAAIRAYEEFTTRLREEYDLEPSTETQALATSIRVERHVAPPPVSARPVSIPADTAFGASRRRLRVGWIALSVAVVVGLVAGARTWLSDPPTAARQIMRFTLEFSSTQALASNVGGSLIALSHDGSRLVYVGRREGGTQLFLRRLDRVDVVPIASTHRGQSPFISPDGRWLGFVAGNTIRKVPFEGGPAITVTTVPTNVPGASWGANDIIVFATSAGLWHVSADGGEPVALALSDTASGERYRHPDVLPSGRGVVFTMVSDAGFQLAAVSLETGTVSQLDLAGTNPRFVAPGYLVYGREDGAVLAVPFDQSALRVTGPVIPVAEHVMVGIGGAVHLGASRSGALAYVPPTVQERALAVVDRSGHSETVPVPSRGFVQARVSPDGRYAATVVEESSGGRWDIWVLDLASHGMRRLTADSGSLAPIWTPDGTSIVYASKPGGREYGFAIRSRGADGRDSAVTLLTGAVGQFPSAFMPGTRALVFERGDPRTNLDLWILALEGVREPQPYVRGAPAERGATISPDGEWLAYASDATGRDEVYVNTLPTPGLPVQVSTTGGWEPRWAPSGRELFYRNEDGMVAVAIDLSSSPRVGPPEVLFDDDPYVVSRRIAAYDVLPDGQHFLMIVRGPEGHDVDVVVNWFPGLDGTARSGSR